MISSSGASETPGFIPEYLRGLVTWVSNIRCVDQSLFLALDAALLVSVLETKSGNQVSNLH